MSWSIQQDKFFVSWIHIITLLKADALVSFSEPPMEITIAPMVGAAAPKIQLTTSTGITLEGFEDVGVLNISRSLLTFWPNSSNRAWFQKNSQIIIVNNQLCFNMAFEHCFTLLSCAKVMYWTDVTVLYCMSKQCIRKCNNVYQVTAVDNFERILFVLHILWFWTCSTCKVI
jgi:hypothetical protein